MSRRWGARRVLGSSSERRYPGEAQAARFRWGGGTDVMSQPRESKNPLVLESETNLQFVGLG